MASTRAYHRIVRRWIPASLVSLGLLLGSHILGASASAQINGTPASVTSPGFGGRAINGTPSSVTSLGPRGVVPSSGFRPFSNPRNDHGRDRRHHRNGIWPYYGYGAVYGVPVPYPDQAYADDGNDSEDSDYQGGPTIFDRRGAGASSYVPPAPEAAPAHSSQSNSETPEPTPSSPTELVFKDGHQIDVSNYAIIGQTLYDLTPGHTRKVPLAELNLEQTEKQNEDRGVTFQLPPLGAPAS
jgi:hypothetical protein